MNSVNKKIYFIYNPQAGMGKIRENLSQIIEIFSNSGFEVTVRPTSKAGDAKSATIEADGSYDIIACSGGDGTLDDVTAGMLLSKSKVPIGYIPAGSTNDFAQSLKIPMNMLDAAEVIAQRNSMAFDMGKFNDKSFVYVAAFGLFTDVSYETSQDMKNTFGHFAYIIEAATRLPQIRSYHMKVEYDGKTMEDDFILGMVSNSLSVGGMKDITGNGVILNDGLFEVTLIKNPVQMQDFTDIATAVFTRSQDNRFVFNFKTNKIKFSSSEDVPWTLDGEFGGNSKNVFLENMQCALEMIVPKNVSLPCLSI